MRANFLDGGVSIAYIAIHAMVMTFVVKINASARKRELLTAAVVPDLDDDRHGRDPDGRSCRRVAGRRIDVRLVDGGDLRGAAPLAGDGCGAFVDVKWAPMFPVALAALHSIAGIGRLHLGSIHPTRPIWLTSQEPCRRAGEMTGGHYAGFQALEPDIRAVGLLRIRCAYQRIRRAQAEDQLRGSVQALQGIHGQGEGQPRSGYDIRCQQVDTWCGMHAEIRLQALTYE